MHDNYSICLLNTKSFCHGLKAVLYDIEWKSFFLAQPWQLTFKVSFAIALNGKINELVKFTQNYESRFFFKVLRFKKSWSQIFQKKKSFGGKAQNILENRFLGFWWKFNLLTCLLYSKMTRSNFVYDSAKTVFLGKIWFSSPLVLCFSSTKCCQPIRMQVSLVNNISWWS